MATATPLSPPPTTTTFLPSRREGVSTDRGGLYACRVRSASAPALPTWWTSRETDSSTMSPGAHTRSREPRMVSAALPRRTRNAHAAAPWAWSELVCAGRQQSRRSSQVEPRATRLRT